MSAIYHPLLLALNHPTIFSVHILLLHEDASLVILAPTGT